jgi:glycine/D-amino acid oxidase-like deaminating enzyme
VKILINFRLAGELESILLDQNIIYRPDLQVKSSNALNVSLALSRPDVIIVRSIPAPEVLKNWRTLTSKDCPLAVIGLIEGEWNEPLGYQIEGLSIHTIDPTKTDHPEVAALQLAESLNLDSLRSYQAIGIRSASVAPARRDVILVGAGIVNLVTAYYLVEAGYSLRIFDSAQDPAIGGNWRDQGCTFGGEDARIFSLNEGRHHQHKGYTANDTNNAPFNRLIDDNGWLTRPLEEQSPTSRAWIEEFRLVPQWLTGRYDQNIISFNQESAPLWREMMTETPALFDNVGFHDGLLRLYAEKERYRRARLKEQAIGAFLRDIDLAELSTKFPSLSDAMEAGMVAGALEVVGFSLNVQKFARALTAYLIERGTELQWNTKVTKILRDGQGHVRSLQLESGEAVTASHYVVSPGAFGNDLLSGFRAENKIAAVAGMWITLPNPGPGLDRPLKISRKGYAAGGAAEGANVIAGTGLNGESVIHISSGHGYIGADPVVSDSAHLDDLTRAVDETAQQYFPRQYRLAYERGLLRETKRYCVRPWTSSGLGLFETVPTAGGGLAIITGGHNTGGFAQAPSVGQAVIGALAGRHHPMHVLYDPFRFTDFAEMEVENRARRAR